MNRQNILVVDDEPLIVQSIKDFLMLKKDKYKVSLAYNGMEAIDVLEKEKVDLIILDLNMPVLDGIQFLTEIYNRKIWLPVIILTKVLTVVSDENSNIFSDFGIIDYLEKPIKVRILDQEYLIKSIEDDEHVQKVAQFVNEKFKEIKDGTEGLSERKTAILAAFDIASEYFQLLKEQNDVVMDIQRRARALNYQIDSVTT